MRSLSPPRQHAPQVGTGAAGSDLFKAKIGGTSHPFEEEAEGRLPSRPLSRIFRRRWRVTPKCDLIAHITRGHRLLFNECELHRVKHRPQKVFEEGAILGRDKRLDWHTGMKVPRG